MELTVENFMYSIRHMNPACMCQNAENRSVSGARQLYISPEGNTGLSPQNIYISTLSQVWKYREYITEQVAILAIGDMELEPEWLQQIRGSVWTVDGVYDTADLLNQAVAIFEEYAAWDKNIHIALLEGKSLQELLDLSSDFIAYPTIVFDSSFNVLAYYSPGDLTYENFMSTIQQGYTDSGTMEMIRQQPVFSQLEKQPQVVGPAAVDPTKTMIYQRFAVDENTLGYGAIYTGDTSPVQGYLDYVALFAENIALCFRRDYQQSHYGKMMYETFLSNLLHTANMSEARIEEQLSAIGDLQRHGNYVLGVLEFAPDTQVPKTFLARILARELWDVHVFLDEERVCLLRNLKTMDDEWFSDWEAENLSHILDHYAYKFGISNLFHDIAQLCFAYRQTLFALKQVQNYAKQVTFYQDFMLRDMFQHFESEMPLEMMQCRLYKQLQYYDTLHKTTYLSMILTYLECDCNATHAAEQLYLHRNTIRKGVALVEERFGIDLKNPHTKQLLRISRDIEEYL